ncbi:MAG: TonB-dependent receptor [Terriglobia bacterium]|jgi:hypothetical protein
MKSQTVRTLTLAFAMLLPLLAVRAQAQTATATIHGQVTDPSGAVVPGVSVMATPAPGQAGQAKAATVGKDGTYQINGLVPGNYSVSAVAQGFSPFDQENVQVTAGQVRQLDIKLEIEQEKEEINVTGQAQTLSVAPENNASATIISGKDLEALSDDPDELQTELEALAGPAAGPSGGQIYIDGFTGGQLPPKDAILEIRVNQNPFSAEYDKLGYGRIEITTKPGFSQFHGNFFADGNDNAFNARSPFAVIQPPYHTEFFNGTIGGPISKKASFFLDAFRRDIQNSEVISAVTVGPAPDYAQVPVNQAVINPLTRTTIAPRVDLQLSSSDVLTMRYQWWKDTEDNDGINSFSLPSQAYDEREVEHTVQISDTQVISSRTVNQTRFQFLRDDTTQKPFSNDLAVNVLGAFTKGGNVTQTQLDTENHYELQNLTTMTSGKHQVVFGGRLRDYDVLQNYTNQGYYGAFTFGTLDEYIAAQKAYDICPAPCKSGVPGATQFSLTAGIPEASINYFDAGLYAEDTWRPRQNISLSLGLRFESQNYINDHADFAPRLGIAWGIGGQGKKAPKAVLRAGFGIFYDRFQEQQILSAEHLNGINQQQYLVNSPSFYPNIPSLSTLASLSSSLPTRDLIDPHLHAPYTVQSAIGLEHQFTKALTTSVTYINSHGVHELLTNDINAPQNFSFCPPSAPQDTTTCGPLSGTFPYGKQTGYLDQFESAGLFNENQLVANFSLRGRRATAFGFYTLSYAKSDTSGATYQPMNPYDIAEDYGPASFISRNQAFVGGSVQLPKGFRLSPFMIASTGKPFNITLGQDVYGTGVFSARPSLAPVGAPASVPTKYGSFYTYPLKGEAVIPPYEFFGPNLFSLNLRLAKTFGFGEKKGSSNNANGGGGRGGYGGGGGGRGGPQGLGGRGLGGGGGGQGMFGGGGAENSRFSLELSVNVRNVFNNINLGPPVGNIGSPLFGQSNTVNGFMGYRHLDLQVRFNF